jgi:Ca2+-binding EF-hand superfamily protein
LKLGSTYENAQQMQSLLKKLDRNGDGKITIDDIQLILQSLGLGSVSPR